MKKHHFGVLISAVIVALVAAFWASSLREPVVDGGVLLPGLEDAVNDVTAIKITAADNRVIATLSRGEESWQLAEKSGYRADNSRVRGLLLALFQARLLEEKTSNPQYYSRLGVEAVDAADAAGVRIDFDGVELPAVIIGNDESTRNAFYARRVDEMTSWLASGAISVPAETAQWFDDTVLNLNPARVAEVEISHPDGKRLVISKSAFGQANFDVRDVPAGRELQRASVADGIANVIEELRIDDVMPLADSALPELSPTQTSFRTFDGLVINFALVMDGDRRLAQISATGSVDVANRYLPEATEEMNTTTAELEPKPAPAADMTTVTTEAEKLNSRISDWVFELKQNDFEQLTRRMQDLLAEETEAAD